jgi:hypothetical protein
MSFVNINRSLSTISPSVEQRRRKYENIINKYGGIVFLQRKCNQPTYGPYDKHLSTCICKGHGYSQTMERWVARKDVVSSSTSLPSSLITTPVGILPTEGTYFFLYHNVNPIDGDRIFEWQHNTSDWRVYKVNKAVDMRIDGGQILYWVAACDLEET